ncbi:MAG TPA: arginine--tRNA ligase, partial [Anaerolineae bacterium]|nr:arginine--tRNA ligase [Anaerolineae bacterium]
RKFGEVVVSQRPELGQFQCNGALAAANIQKTNPRGLAQSVIEALEPREAFAQVSLAGPGFINIQLADGFLAAQVQQIAGDQRLGCSPVASEHILIDFGGPNVAKPMHVGHLRSAIIGDSLQRLCCFMGHQVTSDIHLGDWGTPMGMLIVELKRRQPDLPYFDAAYTGPYPAEAPVTILDLQEMYPRITARCREDQNEMDAALQATVELQQGRAGYQALWRHFVAVSMQELKEDFASLGVTFDLWLGESDYHDRIPQMLEKLQLGGHAQMSEGALVVPLAQTNGQKETPPLMLVKSDGSFLYGTSDLATLFQRVEDFRANRILYVVDARQGLHFKQLFEAAHQIGLAQGVKLEHIAFGTVNGPDGKPFKTRAGGAMRLKDLIAMVTDEALKRMAETGVAKGYAAGERLDVAKKVGLAALKFADLMNHRTSDYIFDLEKFTKFEGRTGPYLLYTAVRLKSILRNAHDKSLIPGAILPPTPAERDVMLTLCELPDAVHKAYLNYAPNYLCDFAYTLAKEFNRFYDQCHILNEKNPTRQSSWLALAQLCLAELELLLSLLGIEPPDRM